MTQFEVLRESQRDLHRLHRVTLEDHVGNGTVGEQCARNRFCQQVDADRLTRHSIDVCRGHDVNDREDDGEEKRPNGGVDVFDLESSNMLALHDSELLPISLLTRTAPMASKKKTTNKERYHQLGTSG